MPHGLSNVSTSLTELAHKLLSPVCWRGWISEQGGGTCTLTCNQRASRSSILTDTCDAEYHTDESKCVVTAALACTNNNHIRSCNNHIRSVTS